MNASCYGFEVTSDIELKFLREGGGDSLMIHRMERVPTSAGRKLIVEFKPTQRNPVNARVHAGEEEGVFDLEIDEEDAYRIDTTRGEIGVVPGPNPVRTEERLWGFPSLLTFLARGDLPLHGASVEVAGRVLLLCAPGKHGKTTLAAAFHRAGYRLLSEDLSCIRQIGAPSVLPGPASLRVRHDVVTALGLTDVETVMTDEDRVHFSIAQHRRGSSAPVPLAGIVLLKDDASRIQLEPTGPVDAIRDLWFLSFNFPTEQDRQRCFSDLTDLASLIPIWSLRRPMRIEALEETVHTLATLVNKDA